MKQDKKKNDIERWKRAAQFAFKLHREEPSSAVCRSVFSPDWQETDSTLDCPRW